MQAVFVDTSNDWMNDGQCMTKFYLNWYFYGKKFGIEKNWKSFVAAPPEKS